LKALSRNYSQVTIAGNSVSLNSGCFAIGDDNIGKLSKLEKQLAILLIA
jgi:enamine deaminase RidA (YjgF/YER057c/UK114 family)